MIKTSGKKYFEHAVHLLLSLPLPLLPVLPASVPGTWLCDDLDPGASLRAAPGLGQAEGLGAGDRRGGRGGGGRASLPLAVAASLVDALACGAKEKHFE